MCRVCSGQRGGVQGNDNIVDGVVLCDYCHADYLRAKRKIAQLKTWYVQAELQQAVDACIAQMELEWHKSR